MVAFYFDFSCPYAYIAACRVRGLLPSAALRLSPILLGGVFNALGHQPMQRFGAARARHNALDIARQAALHGVALNMPARHPMRTVDALRLLLAAPHEHWWPLIDALYRAYWVDGRAIDERDVLRAIADAVGLDGASLVARLDEPALKAELRARTDEAVAQGVFGVPAFLVDGELFWGQDRLPFVARALGLEPDTAPAAPLPRAAPGTVTFYFDFSSPFAWLAAEQVEALCARHDATLLWHPMLLGAVFQQVGAPLVPLHAMPEAKQRMARRDMERFAAQLGLPFTFPSRFPMRSVEALRLFLAAQEQQPAAAPALAKRIFRAYWTEDRDLADLDVLAECCRRVELDPEPLLEARTTPALKERLFARTTAAVEAGVFGAPSFVVTTGGDAPRCSEPIWGQDRLDLVEAWLEGRVSI